MQTLFLDRDGVINKRIPGDYIRSPEAFELLPGVEDALTMLSKKFDLIIVVTNQQGISKGLMSELDLANVHQKMREQIEAAGGRIDAVYHCPHLSAANCPCRKPATGMAWKALQDFPTIDFENCWMVGDSISDMKFAEILGLRKVLIRGKFEELEKLKDIQVDYTFDALLDFARLWAM
ncbi:MAG: HAD family hydrolase [Lewinellaceae bacterium]|nr:HAD family hydrolase [Saprospiraceae bacterium]MCB9344760.1 HAD family hydrolase [Lewinellaceae bacterium]